VKKIKVLDTFSGVGGFSLALEKSIGKENIERIWFSEIDKFSKEVYLNHFPNTPDLGDITKLDIKNLPDFDLLTGGFPCQDVSVAWKQNLEGWRTVLVEYLLQILEVKKPKYFIFENVRGLLGKKFKTFFDSIIKRIYEAWYNINYEILNTKDFWLPQNRERVFIVWVHGKYNNYFSFPEKQELKTFLTDILETEVEEKFYMTSEQYNKLTYESLKRIYEKIAPTLDTAQGWHRQPKIIASRGRYNKDGSTSQNLEARSDNLTNTLTSVEKDNLVCDDVRSREFKKSWFKNISPTLMARDYKAPKQVIKDLEIRKLTPVEYERLQGFPDGWSTKIVSNTQAYKQMGNAISVPVVEHIFDNLLKTEDSIENQVEKIKNVFRETGFTIWEFIDHIIKINKWE